MVKLTVKVANSPVEEFALLPGKLSSRPWRSPSLGLGHLSGTLSSPQVGGTPSLFA